MFFAAGPAPPTLSSREKYSYLVVRAAPTVEFFDEGALKSMLLLDVSSETRVSLDFGMSQLKRTMFTSVRCVSGETRVAQQLCWMSRAKCGVTSGSGKNISLVVLGV